MNVTLTSLEALLLKATHESLPYPDLAALEAFLTIMRESCDGPQLAAQVLAARIHSTNMKEVMLALSFVDRCMRRGDPYFQAEIGKFRFLNEMIKLVSPKYLADRTAPEVRARVLQVLHGWSLEYPKENKFKVAYEMLKFQGVVKETPPPLPPEEEGPTIRYIAQMRSSAFEDEGTAKLLQKLLQSKKPEDIQYANRLIKSMVREEERRDAASFRRTSEMSTAHGSAMLLIDMLNCAKTNTPTPEEEIIMQELYVMCNKMSSMFDRNGELVITDTEEDLGEVLKIINLLNKVQAKYQMYTAKKNTQKSPESAMQQPQLSSSNSLLDFAGAGSNSPKDEPKTNIAKKNTIDELGDIFSTETGSTANEVTMVAEPLKPVNLRPNEDIDLLGDKTKKEGWNELDSLGEQLLKQSLPESARRVDNFNSKPKNKIPMNALTSPKHEPTTSNGALFDLDFFTKKPEEQKSPEPPKPQPSIATDDVMVDITTNNNNNTSDGLILDFGDENVKNENLNKEAMINREKVPKSPEIKPLTDINVTLQSVTPSKVPPLTVFEEEGGITVVLHFCKDKPRPDVNVVVISTTSKNSSPIEDYKFQGVVPKGCKIRLLTPSGTSLPACNPFLPPPALTQVMLVARPPASPSIDLKFVITYTCDDETCSEMGEVKQLPLDDI